MEKRIPVEALPQVNYGRLSWVYKPTCALGERALKACKVKFGYKPVKEGQERATFAPEWQQFLISQGITMVVTAVPTVSFPKVGDTVGTMTDDDFLSML